MGAITVARNRLLKRFGRNVTLSRVGGSSQTLLGYSSALQPQDVRDGLKQGDLRVEIGVADTAPRQGDRLLLDGRTVTVLPGGVETLHDGAAVCGFRLFVRG